MKRIAILTGEAGQGHLSAARAWSSWAKDWGFKCTIVDVLPRVNEVYKITSKSPKSYESLFKILKQPVLSRIMVEGMMLEVKRKLRRQEVHLDDFDIVISTHPLIHPKCRGKKILLLLDPVVHTSYLVKPFLDYYVAYWKQAYDRAINFGMSKDKVVFLGSLARESFYKNIKVAKDPHQILVIAGGEWIEKSKKYLDTIRDVFGGTKYRFVFVCGKNQEFLEKYKQKYADCSNMEFIGWAGEQEMAKLMKESLYSLTFSIGSQVTCELGLSQTFVFIAGYIPGQEDEYKNIISEKGVGILLHGKAQEKIMELKHILTTSKVNEENLKEWKEELVKAPENIRKFLQNI
ncbi:hypothetical protein L6255_04370 [Candidatus Parcubacteria bacterium]|nr:hypothetical protein [Patescibacteria group bacterium]MCG2689644.1 hypothetical protein [Candidatus Parcubacteria bacterium]